VGAAFVVNVVSFAGVLAVLARWRRPVHLRSTPRETVSSAAIAAVRYVRYSPGIISVALRAGVTMFAASAILALLPSLARSVNDRPIVYGLLLGSFGFGAVVGAVTMQPARTRWSLDAVASGAVVILGAMIVASGAVPGS